MRSTYGSYGSYGGSSDARWVSPPTGPQLVRWGSVFAGTVIAIGVFILLGALWLALSFANHDSVVYNNLAWWIGGTAIFCMFLAGLIAGLSSGARGLGAGSAGALTTWALVAMAVVLVVVPTFAVGHVPNFVTVSGHVYKINYLTYWTAFWSLLIGLGAALLGGVIGGIVPRRVDGPFLDLQRATVRETTPVVEGRPPVVQQPAQVEPEAAPVGAHSPTNAMPADRDATEPITPESP